MKSGSWNSFRPVVPDGHDNDHAADHAAILELLTTAAELCRRYRGAARPVDRAEYARGLAGVHSRMADHWRRIADGKGD